MKNILWFQVFKCDNKQFLSVSYHCKLYIFVFWSVGRTTQAIQRLSELVMDFVFTNF